MGEQDSFPSSNSAYVVIMRNSRGKLFVYLAVLSVLCFIVFLLSRTHTSLKELEGVSEKCQQQRDSLSAQLQVVYEHKNRLEKSLQQEKTDHKHSKTDSEKMVSELENKFQKEKDDRQKLENHYSQLQTSYTQLESEKSQTEENLRQQMKTLQSQKDTEIEKLQTHISELLSEKDKLENSNNAFVWKIEQRASELNLCQLQLQQAKKELVTCQEQLQAHVADVGDGPSPLKSPSLPEVTPIGAGAIEQKPAHQEQQGLAQTETAPALNAALPDEQPAAPHPKAVVDAPSNTTSSPPSHESPALLEKPRIMPGNAYLGDGVLPKTVDLKPEVPNRDVLEKPHLNPGMNGENVLPKPLDFRPEERNNDLDRALGATDSKKRTKLAEETMLNNLVNREAQDNMMMDMRREGIHPHPAVAPDLHDAQPQNNHPQVAAPNFEEKDDHAAERGEDGIQYGNLEAKQQVEGPAVGRHNAPQKDFFPIPVQENNDIAQQMNDMMNKSPGEVNNAAEQHVIGPPPHLDNHGHKNLDFKNGNAFPHRGADANRIVDDKNYEEDDDDRENDDEPPNALGPVMKGVNNLLQDNDFDDQENQDNADNAKEEEGVVVAPK